MYLHAPANARLRLSQPDQLTLLLGGHIASSFQGAMASTFFSSA